MALANATLGRLNLYTGDLSHNADDYISPVQCCNSVGKADSIAATKALAAIGVVIQDVNVIVGLECSPISAAAIGSGNTWYA
jgi:hypothetical protein